MAERSRTVRDATLIVLAAALAFLPALGAGFVFDDHALIENDLSLRGSVWTPWTSTRSPDYYPLTWTALWIGRRVFGTAPLGYHVANLALHALVAILLWRALLRLRVPGAWFAAVLFAIHPAAVESVAWVSEIKNTLSGALFVGAALAWLRHDDEGRGRWLVLSTALFALACLAKASVVVLPVALAGVTLFRRGRLDRRDGAALAPLLAVALAAGMAALWFQGHNALSQGAAARGWTERIGGAGFALAHYLSSGLLPVALGFVHDPWPVLPGSPWVLAPAVLLAAGAALLAISAWRWSSVRPFCACAGYQALVVLPVLGLAEMAYFRVGPVSNHLQYLALMGPAALYGWLAATLTRRSRLVVPVAAATTLVFALSTALRASDFRDDLRLWTAAVRDAPRNAFAHARLAEVLSSRGEVSAAQAELAAAADVEPDPARRALYRASWRRSQGRSAEALAEARVALASSGDAEVRSDAAEILLREGAISESEAAFRGLTAAAPASSLYAYHHANALWRLGRRDEAIGLLTAFHREHPGQPEMDKALALALAGVGRKADALEVAAASAGVRPDDPRASAVLQRWLAGGAGAPAPGGD